MLKSFLKFFPHKNRNVGLLLGIFLILLFVYFESFVKADKDFDIFIGAAQLIKEGKSCYNTWIPCGKNFLLYYYSPLFAVILIPLSNLPLYLSYIIWILFNLFFLYKIIFLIDYYLKISGFSYRIKIFFILMVSACILRFLLYNFDLGQMTIFLVFASLESIRLIHENKKWQGAALLALAINIKLLPLSLIFYLIYRSEFKSFALVIFFSIVYLILPILFIDISFNNFLLNEWWNTMTTTIDRSIIDDVGRESLSALIPSYIMEIKEEITFKRNLINLSLETTITILTAFRATLILLTLYFLRALPFKKMSSPLVHFYSLSYIMLITPLISPHQGKYSFFYLFPAFCYVVYSILSLDFNKPKLLFKNKIAICGILISFVFTTLTTDGIIGRNYSNIVNYYHLITIGALILIMPMIILKPENLLNNNP